MYITGQYYIQVKLFNLLITTSTDDKKGEHIFSVINEKVIGTIKQSFHLVAHTFTKAKKYYHV